MSGWIDKRACGGVGGDMLNNTATCKLSTHSVTLLRYNVLKITSCINDIILLTLYQGSEFIVLILSCIKYGWFVCKHVSGVACIDYGENDSVSGLG